MIGRWDCREDNSTAPTTMATRTGSTLSSGPANLRARASCASKTPRANRAHSRSIMVGANWPQATNTEQSDQVPNIDVTKIELVWPGKYKEDGTRVEVPRVGLPFQVIETVNESRAAREAKKVGAQATLFDVYEGKE